MAVKERLPPGKQVRDQAAAANRDPQLSPVTALAVIVAIVAFLYLVRNILLPFVLAGIVAYVFTPLIDWFDRHSRLPRWCFALIILLLLMGLAAIVGLLGAPVLMREILRVGGDLHGAVEELARQLIGNNTFHIMDEAINASQIADYAVNGIRNWFSQSGQVFTVAALGFVAFFGFIVTWVLLGYLLIEAPRIAEGLFWLVPPKHRPFVSDILSKLDPILRRYFVGVVLVVLYASIAAYIGLGAILGLKHAVVLALLTGILEMIPLVGPAAAAVIAGLVAVQEAKNTGDILAYIFYAMALRISIDQFFGPIVLGRAARVRPVVVIFCFLTGAILFGAVGVVLAVPVALTIKVVLGSLYDDPRSREY